MRKMAEYRAAVAAERKKAKTMNFSIAYGKSAIGFSKDWVKYFFCKIKFFENNRIAVYQKQKKV